MSVPLQIEISWAIPTENPDFKKVVSHFLNSPPKPHDQSKKGGGKGAKAKRANDE